MGALGVETETLRKPGIPVVGAEGAVTVVAGAGEGNADFGCWSLLGERIDEGGRMEERCGVGVGVVGEGTPETCEVGWGMPSLSLLDLSMDVV